MTNVPVELTKREREILKLVVEGASSREAAATLGISPRTVEFHRANVMHKLSARNVADLVRIAFSPDALSVNEPASGAIEQSLPDDHPRARR